EPGHYRRVAPIVRIVVGRVGIGRIAVGRFDVRPAVVGASRTDVDFLDRGRVVVAAHVADNEAPGGRIVIGAERVAQTERPDCIIVGPRAVIERIVGWYGAVHIEAQDFATWLGEILRFAGVEMLAGRDQDLPIVAEIDRSAVMLGVSRFSILIDDELAAGDRAG